jgi:hypothetical protein
MKVNYVLHVCIVCSNHKPVPAVIPSLTKICSGVERKESHHDTTALHYESNQSLLSPLFFSICFLKHKKTSQNNPPNQATNRSSIKQAKTGLPKPTASAFASVLTAAYHLSNELINYLFISIP